METLLIKKRAAQNYMKVLKLIAHLTNLESQKNSLLPKGIANFSQTKEIKMTPTKKVQHIYIDGSAPNNQTFCFKAGFGMVVYNEQGEVTDEYSQAVTFNPSNQRAELEALLYAMRYANNGDYIYTDSNYCLKGVTEWHKRWEVNGWLNSSKKPIEHKDIWWPITKLAKDKQLNFVKVKAHSGNVGNDRADELACRAARS